MMKNRTDYPIDLNDAALVERIREGDDDAFSKLYRRHARYLAKIIYRILGNHRDLDDMMQETFISALHHIDTLKTPEKVRPWLVQIAVRHTRKRLEKTKRLSKLHWHAYEQSGDREETAEKIRTRLYAALDALDEKLRIPVILFRIEGMTLKETAEACDVSLSTVKRRISSAEEKLERMLHAHR